MNKIIALPLFLLLFFAQLVSATTVTVPGAVSYGGAYWITPSSTYVQFQFADSSIYSCSVGSNTGFSWESFWGDGTENSGIWSSGFQFVNGYSEVGGGQRCNVGYIQVPSASNCNGDGVFCPSVGYATDGSPNLQVYHQYLSLGKYNVQDSDSHGNGFATVYSVFSPSVALSIASPTTSIDVGDAILINVNSNCGSGTYCANVQYPGNAGTGIVPSVYSLSSQPYTISVVGVNVLQVCDYDPLASSNVCTSTRNVNAYPDINAPTFNTITYNQYSSLSYSYTVNVPQQIISGNEGQPTMSVNFGDGNTITISSWSSSGTNWQSTFTHAYPTGGNYLLSMNAISFNYATYGSQYGSQSSTSATINVTTYVPPSVNSITPNTILEASSGNFLVSLIQGNFLIKNTTIFWGDGTNTLVTGNALSFNALHTYPFFQTPIPKTFTANIVICDVQSVCSTSQKNIIGTYTLASINSITPTSTYSTLSTPFTFNIIQGNYAVSSLQINWGDSSTSFVSINSVNPAVTHTYNSPGNYPILATVIDVNSGASNTFTQNEQVLPYILPKISQLTPSSVTAGNSVTYSFIATQGTFPFLTTNGVKINFGVGNTLFQSNIINGINHISFTYPALGNFTAIETIYDNQINFNMNATLISVSGFPWNFTTPKPIINYTVTNSSLTQEFVQTNQTDILNVSYTVQNDNVVNDYICTTSISNGGLFSIRCVTNPNSISYVEQTLFVTIYAKDTAGVIKSVTEQINLIPNAPNPIVPTQPFSPQTVSPPLKAKAFIPINPVIVLLFVATVLVAGVIFWRMYTSRQTR